MKLKKQYTLLFANATDSRHLCIVGKVVALFFFGPFQVSLSGDALPGILLRHIAPGLISEN